MKFTAKFQWKFRQILPLLCLVASSAFAADWGAWQDVKLLAEQGKTEEAILTLRSHPQESSAYFFNLGTLLLTANRTGEALANLEKANRLRPHDPEIQSHLRIAKETLKSVLGAEKQDPASSGLETLADQIPRDEGNGAIGLIALIIGGLWARAYSRHRNWVRTVTQTSGGLSLVGLALIAALYALLQVGRANPPAILVERQAVKSGPGDQFAQMSQLEAGVKVRVTGVEDQGWSQVRHEKDTFGWIRTSSLLLL
jgi:hypothetical protein